MSTLAGRTLFITGASRGIGLAIALRAASASSGSACEATQRVPSTIASNSSSANIIGGSRKPGRSW